MPPHTTYFSSTVTLDVAREHADPSYSSSKGPLVSTVETHRKFTKSVSFNEIVRAKRTMHISNFSAEEIRCCWYNNSDYEVMKGDLQFEVSLLENDCLVEKPTCTMTHSSRGLEMFSSTITGRARREIKRQARNTVLEEQRLQREEGSHDPEFLAEVYSVVTKAASQIAIQQAVQGSLLESVKI